jgi:hypothetical protein
MYNHKFQDERLYVPENYSIFLKHVEDTTEGDIFDMADDNIDFMNYFDKLTSRAKISVVNKEKSYFKKIVAGDDGDNILSVVKTTPDARGIAEKGSDIVYAMFKLKYPNEIDFNSDEFIVNLCDVLSIYKKNKETEFIEKISENIKFSRTLTRLEDQYLPLGYKQILLNNIKI